MSDYVSVALVVDDDVLVGMATADMLTEAGYDVTEASSGHEAVELVKSGLCPDLLVTDQSMPGMLGTEVADRLRELLPSLRVVIATGYSAGITTNYPQLNKPFYAQELIDCIVRKT